MRDTRMSTEHMETIVPGTNVPKNPRDTNVTKNHTDPIQNSARATNLPNNKTEHVQNSAQGTNVTVTNISKTVRDTQM